MAMTDEQWVALNLPRNSRFSKNGVTVTVADAITMALDATKSDAANVKERALAMLLRMLAADYRFETERIGESGYTKQQLTDLAEYWEGQAKAPDGSVSGDPMGIVSVPAVFESLSGGECL